MPYFENSHFLIVSFFFNQFKPKWLGRGGPAFQSGENGRRGEMKFCSEIEKRHRLENKWRDERKQVNYSFESTAKDCMLRPAARSTAGEQEERGENKGKQFVDPSRTEFHNQISLR